MADGGLSIACIENPAPRPNLSALRDLSGKCYLKKQSQSTGFYLGSIRADSWLTQACPERSRMGEKTKPIESKMLSARAGETPTTQNKANREGDSLRTRGRDAHDTKQSQSRARCSRHARARRPRHKTKPIEREMLSACAGETPTTQNKANFPHGQIGITVYSREDYV
jgi:hypothetical protein